MNNSDAAARVRVRPSSSETLADMMAPATVRATMELGRATEDRHDVEAAHEHLELQVADPLGNIV